MYLEHRLAPGAPTNVMVARFAVDGGVDVGRLRHAVDALLAETESLRTVVRDQDGEPRPVIIPPRPVHVPLIDLRDAPDPSAALDAWLGDRAPLPFCLDRLLIEFFLARLAEDRHVVVIRQHHLITDAESHALLWRRLTELYGGTAGEALLPMSVHRSAERAYRESDLAERDARWWVRQREEAPAPPTFYGVQPRARSGLLRRVELRLDEARSAKLDAACARGPFAMPSRDMSRHVLYATTLYAYLWRVTGERRLALGCPLANRRSRRVRRVVGMVMEQSPMLAEVRHDDSFVSLSGRVREALKDLLRHGRACVSNPSHAKLYDAVLNVHRVSYAPLDGAPVRGSIAPALTWAKRWPAQSPDGGEAFSLTVYADGDRETLAFDLNRDVFDDALAARASRHFMLMLDAVLADPLGAPADVDLLTPGERRVVAAPPPRLREESFLHDVLAMDGERRVIDEMTLRDLLRRAGGIARALRANDVGRGGTVAVATRRGPDLPAALLGVMLSGAAYVPLDPSHPRARIDRVLEDAAPVALVSDGSLALPLPTVDLGDVGEAAPPRPDVKPDDLAYVLFTSGSTGRPKGVEITHGNLAAFLRAMLHVPGLTSDDRVLAITTPAFDISTFELFAPLMVGAAIVLADDTAGIDGARLRALIEEADVSVIQATPPTWRLLLGAGWEGGARIKAMCGGEPMPRDLAEALIARTGSLWNVYGPTETTVWCSAQRVDAPTSPLPIGRPLPFCAMRVLGPGGLPAPFGVVGEIAVAGPSVARGYRGRPELSAEVFVPDVVDPASPMYRSGDQGRWRPDGTLECLGRADGQVKIRGFRVELGEVEAALRAHPDVDDAAVLLEDDGASATLVAHVAGETLDVGALAAHAAERLPSYMRPSRWSLQAELPLGPTGKIDRRALEARQHAPVTAITRRAAPRDDTEAVIAGIWAEALNIPRVGVTDDFFAVGGHSLAAAHIVDGLRAAFSVEVPLGALFEARTVEKLAETLRTEDGRAPCELVTLAHGRGTPIFCICGVQVYHPLASRLGGDRPVYGVYLAQEESILREAREGRAASLSVGAMAEAYTDVIRRRQPRGPYSLAGLSFGGVLAYEIAQRLRDGGEEVALLALFDTVIPSGLRRAPLKWARAHLRAIRRAPLEEAKRAFRRARGGDETEMVAGVRERAYVAAMRRYQPRTYDGEVLLFRAAESSFGEGWVATRDGGLGPYAPRMRVFDVPGRHVGMMHPPHVDTLAAKLRRFAAPV
ncbi:MAG: amino acid adenylation domain-containing protein [Sandaracinaceae bacterium]